MVPSYSQTTQKKKGGGQSGTPIIWAAPGKVEKLDFASGPGGRAGTPKPPFAFIEESLSGTTPKVRIGDANGVR